MEPSDKLRPRLGPRVDLLAVNKAFAEIDAAGNPGKVLMLAIRALADAGSSVSADPTAEDGRRFLQCLTLAHLATGSILGGKRDLLVKAIS